jgi:GTPase SAR1 family protein
MHKNRTIGLTLWDTAGQEDYDKLRPLSYPETDIFIVCFDVTGSTSFENVKYKWISEIRNYCPRTPIMLCGTKSDLRDNTEHLRKMEKKGQSLITQDMGKKAARELGCVDYMECSARTQHGLKQLFDHCIDVVLEQHEPKEQSTWSRRFSSNSSSSSRRKSGKQHRCNIL